MNKITKVMVTDLFDVTGNDYTVIIRSQWPVSFIYGVNGIGKTTLFKLLDAAFPSDTGDYKYKKTFEVFREIPFTYLTITFDTEDTLKIEPCRSKGHDEVDTILYFWKNEVRVVKFDMAINYIDNSIFDEIDKIHVKLWYADPLQDPETKKTENDVSPDKSAEGMKFVSYTVRDRFAYVQSEIKEYAGLKNKIDLFEKVINEGFGLTEKSIGIDEFGKIAFTASYGKKGEQQDDSFGMRNLSFGEKNLLHLCFQLIFKLPDGDSCKKDEMYLQLIDEPETSMHSDWLVDFYYNLMYIKEKLGWGENYQFLIATHSTAITLDHCEMMTPMWRGNDA